MIEERTPVDAEPPDLVTELCARGFEHLETHISHVFLTDNDVFKVKKSVDLGFLDFSSLELRHEACISEVELNRRLAPDVYLGVVPILQRDGHFEFGKGELGEVAEWAVHMRRLPDADRADQLLAAGRFTPAHAAALALRLAHFHAEAQTSDDIASFGSYDVIQRNVKENFDQTRDLIGNYLDGSAAREIEKWQTDFLASHRELLASRATEGRVRDGHGDLRLEHVYFADGRADGHIDILDCIEFNDRFRYADVCADVAFLAMDLTSAGAVGIAEQLLADYAKEAHDYGLYSMIDFYESYRAFVRGKVCALTESLAPQSSADRKSLQKQARHHFLLAQASERRPAQVPRVIAVGGWIATGKSTVAREVGAMMECPVVSADLARKWLLDRAPTEQAGEAAFEGGYSESATASTYREVFQRAEQVLASSRSVVLDASFRSRTHRQLARRLASERGLEFLFIECQAPREVCIERLEERAKSAHVSEGRVEIFDQFVAAWEDVKAIPQGQHIELDTGGSYEGVVATLRDRLAALDGHSRVVRLAGFTSSADVVTRHTDGTRSPRGDPGAGIQSARIRAWGLGQGKVRSSRKS